MMKNMIVSSYDLDKASISVFGEDKDSFRNLNFDKIKVYDHGKPEVLIAYSDDRDYVRNLLQGFLDNDVPFLDGPREPCYFIMLYHIDKGIFSGVPVRCIWKNGEYIIADKGGKSSWLF